MSYQHQYVDGTRIHFPLGKVVCIGRNYAEHAKELDNPIPTEPLLFIKPGSCVVPAFRCRRPDVESTEVPGSNRTPTLVGVPTSTEQPVSSRVNGVRPVVVPAAARLVMVTLGSSAVALLEPPVPPLILQMAASTLLLI